MSIPALAAASWNWSVGRSAQSTDRGPVPPAEAVPEVRHGRGALPEDVVGRMPPVDGKQAAEGSNRSFDRWEPQGECQTCENRKYQDGSDDPGVSFKSPTKLSPERAATAVIGHEMEHVSREQDKARRTGREVVTQSVSIHNSICPECHRVYVSGGTTRTTTRSASDLASLFQQPEVEEKGKYLDIVA